MPSVPKKRLPCPFYQRISLAAVQVYRFAEQLQALDILLFYYVQLSTSKSGGAKVTTEKCGYVSSIKL